MTVEVKKVGNYKIHVKETAILSEIRVLLPICLILLVSVILAFANITADGLSWKDPAQNFLWVIVGLLSIPTLLVCAAYDPFGLFFKPAYYVDTTMYGVGGEIVLKTTPEQDHIAICRAAQKFEKEILEKIAEEERLKQIVGECK